METLHGYTHEEINRRRDRAYAQAVEMRAAFLREAWLGIDRGLSAVWRGTWRLLGKRLDRTLAS